LADLSCSSASAPNGVCSERDVLYGVCSGRERPEAWEAGGRTADVFFLKGILEQLKKSLDLPLELGAPDASYALTSLLHPHRALSLRVNGKSARQARLDRDYGIVFQTPVLYEWRTVLENVRIAAQSRRHSWNMFRHHLGFRDILELGRRDRPHMYGLTGIQRPLIPRDCRWEVDERLDYHVWQISNLSRQQRQLGPAVYCLRCWRP